MVSIDRVEILRHSHMARLKGIVTEWEALHWRDEHLPFRMSSLSAQPSTPLSADHNRAVRCLAGRTSVDRKDASSRAVGEALQYKY